MNSSDLDFVPTKFSKLNNKSTPFEAVVYESYSKQKRKSVKNKNSVLEKDANNTKGDNTVMDMKKVRYDVFKFAMSSFKSEEKEIAKINLAIQLGAKPAKNKYYNYKEFKEMKKLDLNKKSEKNVPVSSRLPVKIATRRTNVDKIKKKPERNILESYGNPGKVKFNKKRRHK